MVRVEKSIFEELDALTDEELKKKDLGGRSQYGLRDPKALERALAKPEVTALLAAGADIDDLADAISSTEDTVAIPGAEPRNNDLKKKRSPLLQSRSARHMLLMKSYRKRIRPLAEAYLDALDADADLAHRDTLASAYLLTLLHCDRPRDAIQILRHLQTLYGHDQQTVIVKKGGNLDDRLKEARKQIRAGLKAVDSSAVVEVLAEPNPPNEISQILEQDKKDVDRANAVSGQDRQAQRNRAAVGTRAERLTKGAITGDLE